MTPPADRPALRASTPSELLALVPYLIGYHPTSSLVCVALTDSRVLNLARLDLPTTADQLPDMQAAILQIAATISTYGATGAILIGYGTAGQVHPGMQAADMALAAVSVPVQEALLVDAGRYWSYLCDNPDCCPPDGVPFDPTTSAVAAAATVAGMVALPDRAALAARLAPVTGAARDRMVEATAALFTVLLDVPPVREFAARHTTAAAWEVDMWVDLVRRAEPDFAAGPAIMLTLSALQAGDGTLAALAVQRALQADPVDRLAVLLANAVAVGVDPATVTALLAG
jgi:Domain of unknown function (DUF4192)